ncbi:MAG TPA: class I SAM-dependent methyltransferase [Planctomycetota bacterium]|nr:class I SAM-dependent methyltransferase [Planctomycetota bacterium]
MRPAGWDAVQADFYAETIAASDYAEVVAPHLRGPIDDFLDVGAGSGLIAGRVLGDGARWTAVEPEPAMQARLRARAAQLAARGIRFSLHPTTWAAMPPGAVGDVLMAANLGATHYEAAEFHIAVQPRWRREMVWVVAAQNGPSTFCLAGFLPPELHGAPTQPAVERTLAQLGPGRAPDEMTTVDWSYRVRFPDLAAAQAHFLDRLALSPGSDRARAIADFVGRHAQMRAEGVTVGCPKRSAILRWRRR